MKKAYILDIYDMISESQNGKRKVILPKTKWRCCKQSKAVCHLRRNKPIATDATKASQRLG
jgi:hypothetical protein